MSKIIAINLNTSIDNIQIITEFKLGSIMRSKNSLVYPSGKGINSARVIDTLGAPVLVLGFVGKDYFNYFNSIRTQNITTSFLKVSSPSRINTTLLTESNTFVAHIQGVGITLTSRQIIELNDKINSYIKSDDIIILSGSLPFGLSSETYTDLVKLCKRKARYVIFDSSQPSLQYGIAGKPDFIKPNIEELSELIGRPLENEIEIVNAAKSINEKGVKNVIVSMGADGIILTNSSKKDTYLRLRLDIDIKETTGDEIGCGDSLIGGLAVGLHQGMKIEDSLKLAISCGAANLYEVGPGTCNLADITRLLKLVKIEIKEFKSKN